MGRVQLDLLRLLAKTRARGRVQNRVSILVALTNHFHGGFRRNDVTVGRENAGILGHLLLFRTRARRFEFLIFVAFTVLVHNGFTIGRVLEVTLGDSFLVVTRTMRLVDFHFGVSNAELLGVNNGGFRGRETMRRVMQVLDFGSFLLNSARALGRLDGVFLFVSLAVFGLDRVGGTLGLEFELILRHAFLVAARTVGSEDSHALVSLAEFLDGGNDGTVGRVDPLALHLVHLVRARALLLLAHLDLQLFVALAELLGCTVGGEFPVFRFLLGVFRAGTLGAHHFRLDSFVAITDFGDDGTVLGEESLVLGDILLSRTGAGGHQFFQEVAFTVDGVDDLAVGGHLTVFLLHVLLVRTRARSLQLLFFVTHTVDGGNFRAVGSIKVVLLVLAR